MSDLIDEETGNIPVGVKCINGICFRADMFNKEQMDLLNCICKTYYENGRLFERDQHSNWIKIKKFFGLYE